jgi:hypothetical protein
LISVHTTLKTKVRQAELLFIKETGIEMDTVTNLAASLIPATWKTEAQ